MALDPRLSLGVNADIGGALNNAILNAGRIQGLREQRAQAQRNKLLQPLIEQQQRQQLELQGQQVQQGRQQQMLSLAKRGIEAFGRGDSAGVESAITDMFSSNPERQRAEIAEFRANPQQYVNEARDIVNSAASGVSAKNKFIGTPQRVVRGGKNFLVGIAQQPDGSFGLQEVPVEGEFVSTLGETASQQTQREAEEAGLVVRSKEQEQQRQDFVKQGIAARGLARDTDRLIELNKLISTGKTAQAEKAFGDLFGVTDPNLGEFNAKAGQLILGQIRLLGANPTEGERAFLEKITPSIQQGGAVNDALLKDIREVQQRQVDRAKWLAKNPEKTVEEYFLLTDVDDFFGESGTTAQEVKPEFSGFKILSIE
jgi:hypothetical protein